MKNTRSVRFFAHSAMIAALYVALTYAASLLGLSSGAIQIRFSEALTVLPYFTFAAVPGLFIGCLLANILTGCIAVDVVFGSLATLIGALLTYLLRRRKWLAPVPPILANTLIVPFVIAYGYKTGDALPYLMLTVGAGEIISAGVLGMLLLLSIERTAPKLFKGL